MHCIHIEALDTTKLLDTTLCGLVTKYRFMNHVKRNRTNVHMIQSQRSQINHQHRTEIENIRSLNHQPIARHTKFWSVERKISSICIWRANYLMTNTITLNRLSFSWKDVFCFGVWRRAFAHSSCMHCIIYRIWNIGIWMFISVNAIYVCMSCSRFIW